MRRRAKPSGVVLSEADVAIIKSMINRGDRQHDIAAYFGVNGGRIADVATGKRWWWVRPASLDCLPPPGPYPVGKQAVEALAALNEAKTFIRKLEDVLAGQSR